MSIPTFKRGAPAVASAVTEAMDDKKAMAGKSALVIVAHPDDETIWLGGFILAHPSLKWTILSLCRASDRDRAPKFLRVCRALGARGIITDLDDEGRLSEREALPIIRQLILQKAGKKSWNYLFTHGANGEYGHPRHKSVHRVVKQMTGGGELKIKKVFFLNYKKISKYKLAPKTDSNLIFKLKPGQFRKKIALMTDIYGFAPAGIDAGFCTNPEAFKIMK